VEILGCEICDVGAQKAVKQRLYVMSLEGLIISFNILVFYFQLKDGR